MTRPWPADDVSLNAERAQRRARGLARLVFGDRYGLVLFLAILTFVATYWRIGVFITDSYAIANALVNVADGHLAVTEITYSLTLGSQPGLWYSNGAVYGRNYAHVFVSLPVLWTLEGLTFLFDPRLVIVAGHSMLVLAVFDQVGRLTDRYTPIALAGSIVALVLFVGQTLVASPLSPKWLAFMSLQITSMLAVATTALVLYRVLAHIHDRRVGLLVGSAAVLASPVGFWASLPKRHAFSTLAVVGVLGAFYFSRAANDDRRALGFRALAYAILALFAWLHALEALVVFVAFVPVDLATARSRHPRQLAVVGVVFLVALSPFLLTNLAITGNPLQPPRSLEPFSGQVNPLAENAAGGGGEGGESGGTPTPTPPSVNTTESATTATATTTATASNTTNGTATTPTPNGTTVQAPESGKTPNTPSSPGPIAVVIAIVVELVTTVVDRSIWAIGRGWSFVDNGINVVQNEPDRLYHTFLRSGRISEYINYKINEQEAVDLALLEVAPLLGGLLGVIGAGARRLKDRSSLARIRTSLHSPARQTDVLAVAITILFVLMNLERLPVHAQLTVRYLVPIVPLGLYGVGRLAAVQHVVDHDWRWLAGSYVAVVVLGGIGVFSSLSWLDLAIGEAMQLHALLGLASAGVLALWALAGGFDPTLDTRLGAVALAFPAALTTLFLLFTGIIYFQYAQYALPVTNAITNWIPVAV